MTSLQLNHKAQQEWVTLQNQQDSYEKYSLLIKLFHILIVCLFLLFTIQTPLLPILSAVLWLQDGIWKTFQNRFSQRLVVLETGISENDESVGMQFNRQWLLNRPSGLSIIKEYALQSMRPTIAFPHFVLLAISTFLVF